MQAEITVRPIAPLRDSLFINVKCQDKSPGPPAFALTLKAAGLYSFRKNSNMTLFTCSGCSAGVK